MQSGDFEVEDTHRDRKACVRLNKFAVTGHPSDGVTTKFPKRRACILVLGLRGNIVF
jgi:hypothetical protein